MPFKYSDLPTNADIMALMGHNGLRIKCPAATGPITHNVRFDIGPQGNDIPTKCNVCNAKYTTDQRIELWEKVHGKTKTKVHT